MTTPSIRAILLALIPFVALCFSVSAWDRVYPMVFGLPFNFFWVLAWTVLTPAFTWGAYRIEVSRAAKASGDRSHSERQP